MAARLELLGGFRLTVEGEPRRLVSRKAQFLLARLALAGPSGLGREALCALLWETSGEPQARLSLRQALARARRALDDEEAALVSIDDRLALDPDLISSDVRDLEAATAAKHEDVRRLLGGMFLDGVVTREPAIEEWLTAERRRLAGLEIEALERDAEAAFASRDLPRALDGAARVLARDQLRESACRLAMRILAARGEPAAALKAFRDCREALMRDLGVRPAPETVAVFEEIRATRAAGGGAEARRAQDPDAASQTTIREAAVLVVLPAPAEEPDPDEAAEIERLTEAEAARAGAVFLSAPDGAMLAFGLRGAHEDDLGRARRAARALLEAAPRARLGLAAGRVAFEPGPPLIVSGEVRGVAAARALGARPGTISEDDKPLSGSAKPGEAALRPDAPFIGRLAERTQLAAARDLARSSGAIALISGEPGIGKTRLVEVFAASVEAEGGGVARIGFEAFGRRTGAAEALFCALGEGDWPASATANASAAHAAMRAWLQGKPRPPGGEALLTAASPERFEQLAVDVTLDLLKAAPGVRVVIVEDAHWAPAEDLAFLLALARRLAEAKALLIVTERRLEARFGPRLRRAPPDAPLFALEMTPFGLADARRLAAAIGIDGEETVRAVMARSEGNPLFLVRLLLSGPSAGKNLPPSVMSLVQEQTDRLSAPLALALRRAAILGQSFDAANFVRLFGEADFGSLMAAGLLISDGARLAFAHALVHEAVYASTPRAERRRLHAQAAAGHRDVDPLLWADHALAAGSADAAKACAAAAELLGTRHAFTACLRYIEAGLAVEGDADSRAQMLNARGGIARVRGAFDDALSDYAAAMELAEDPEIRAQAHLRCAWVHRLRGDEAIAEALLAETEREHAAGLTADLRSELAGHRGAHAFIRGDHAACLAWTEQALELAESALHRSRAYGGIGDAHHCAGRMRSAMAAFEECVTIARANGFGVVELAHGHMLAFARYVSEPGPEALSLAEMAVERARDAGDARSEMVGLQVLFDIQLEADRLIEAQESLEREELLMAPFMNTPFAVELAWEEARLAGAIGDRDRAVSSLAEAFRRLDPMKAQYCGAELHGESALLTFDREACAEEVARGEALVSNQAMSHSTIRFRVSAALAWLAHGDAAAAERQATALEDYTRAEPLGWADLHIAHVRLRAAALRLGIDAERRDEAARLAARLEDGLMRRSAKDLRAAFGIRP